MRGAIWATSRSIEKKNMFKTIGEEDEQKNVLVVIGMKNVD
jgi:hypothetical protein